MFVFDSHLRVDALGKEIFFEFLERAAQADIEAYRHPATFENGLLSVTEALDFCFERIEQLYEVRLLRLGPVIVPYTHIIRGELICMSWSFVERVDVFEMQVCASALLR